MRWARGCSAAALWVAVLLAAAPAAQAATGAATTAKVAPAPCDLPGVRITGRVAQDVADACQGARDAIGYFSQAGLRTDTPIVIHIQEDFPKEVGASAAGCYLERDGLVLLRPYTRFAAARTWFKVPVSRKLYRSLATHEVAHALASCNFGIDKPTIQAKEYLAYVTMFSTMDVALHGRILKAYPGEAPEADCLTELLFMFDPMLFGVRAFRHHQQAGGSTAFMQEVLAGRALND